MLRIGWVAGAMLALACASAVRVVEVDAARRQALVAGDVAALSELLADGLSYGHANGEVQPKPELLASLASGELRHRAIRYHEFEAREVGGAFVVSGRQTVEVTARGRELTSESVFVAVYMRARGRWQLVAYQSAPAPTGASAAEPRAQ
jgi:hypothetical protein